MTLDGKTAAASGDSRWISGPRSRALVHEVRGRMDAIVVGIGTALADDPELTARPPVLGHRAGSWSMARVACRRQAGSPRLLAKSRSWSPSPIGLRPTVVEALATLGVRNPPVSRFGPRSDPPPPRRTGTTGHDQPAGGRGGRLLGGFLDAGQVDAVDVFIAPLVEGEPRRSRRLRDRGIREWPMHSALSGSKSA